MVYEGGEGRYKGRLRGPEDIVPGELHLRCRGEAQTRVAQLDLRCGRLAKAIIIGSLDCIPVGAARRIS